MILFEESKLDESVEQQISDKVVYFLNMIEFSFVFHPLIKQL